MQAIPEYSKKQTNVCLRVTLCTITAFNNPPKSGKATVFAFGSVTNLQEERMCSRQLWLRIEIFVLLCGKVLNNLNEKHKHKCEQNCRFPSFASIFHCSHKQICTPVDQTFSRNTPQPAKGLLANAVSQPLKYLVILQVISLSFLLLILVIRLTLNQLWR